MASEEIFLTLRSIQNTTALFCFDERNLIHAAPGLIGYTILENAKKNFDASLCYSIEQQKIQQQKQQKFHYQQCSPQQKMINADLANNQLYKNQQLNIQNLSKNKQKEITIIDLTLPITSSSNTAMIKNLSITNDSIPKNDAQSFIDNKIPLQHLGTNISQPILVNTFKQNTKQHKLANSYLYYNDVNNIENKFNSLSSIVSTSSASETDFDEIDECIAAEVCAREKKTAAVSQYIKNFNLKNKNKTSLDLTKILTI